MESSTSYTERYIIISNIVIRNIGDLGGVDGFRLYVELLLQKNWRNELLITPNLLLRQLKRSKQYWSKQLIVQLQTLVKKNIIRVDSDLTVLGINESIKSEVLRIAGAATEIKCINTEIFNLQTSVSVNTLFAVFVYLKMATDKNVGFARVAMKTIAEGLALSEKTIEKAIKVLEDNGFVRVSKGVYVTALSQNECNKYRTDDYGSLMYKVKHGLAKFPMGQVLSEKAEADIEKKIVEVLSEPQKYSPCVFKDLSAKLFYEYYSELEYDNLFTINTIKDMTEVLDEYGGILNIKGGVIVLKVENLTEGVEDCIIKFIKNSVLPIVLLLNDDVEINNGSLKSQLNFVFS